MANKLMFQVGVEQAVAGLDKVKKELDQFVTDYGKKMQIQVDVKNLEAFINALKTIGSGEQLRPLLDQVERLQNRLTAMADKNTYLDFVKGEAAAAAATLKIAQENYEKVKKLGNVVNTSDRKRELDNAFIKNEEAQSRLNSALERLKTEEKSAGDAAIDLKTRLDAVKNSVQDLNSRVGGGIKFEVDKDLKNFDFKSLLRNLTSLADKKDKATVGESSLATETNKARATLAAEEMQAEKTAAALNNATNSIIAATLAAKNMYTVMGGNSSEVAKFMELANQMDAVNRKIALVMSQEKGDFSKGKNNVLGDLNKEMADIQARMDELKKSTSIGNPIVEAFTSAYSGLASVLKEAGSAMSNTSGSVKKLDEAMTQAIQNGNKPIVDTAQANASAQAVEKQAVTFEQVKKSLESVYAMSERIQAMPVMKGNFGMMGEWDMISKEKLANMQTFAKSVRFMQDELKEATTVETLRSSDSTLIDSLKEYLNAIKQTITFAKKELKKNLGEEEAAELQKKIAILEQLKASYNDAYSVLSKKNNLSNFANFEGYNITKENFAAKKADIDQVNEAIRKTFEEESRVAKSKTQVAEATEKNTQALTQEAQSAGMTKEQMETLAAAKQKVNEAEQNQTKVNEQNTTSLKQEGEQSVKTAEAMEKVATSSVQTGESVVQQKEKLHALQKEIKDLEEGPLKRWLEIQDKLRALAGNWRVRPDALGLGDAKKQTHDILDLAAAIQKYAASKGKLVDGSVTEGYSSGRIIAEKEAIAVLAKEYKLTNAEAAKYLQIITQSELVSRKFKTNLSDGQFKIWERGGYPGNPSSPLNQVRERYYNSQEHEEWQKNGAIIQKHNELIREKNDLIHKIVTGTKQVSEAENKPTTKGGIFDTQTFTSLQEAIDKIISEINRLRTAFEGIGKIEGLEALKTSVNGLQVEVNNLVSSLTKISGALHIDKSAEEIAALEKKINDLKAEMESLQNKTKELNTNVQNAGAGMKTQAEKKGSESILADNLQKLKTRIADVQAEFNRLNEAYGQAKTMGMPVNMDIEQRLDALRRLIQMMQMLEEAAKKTENATKKEQEIRESLSKSKAFSFVQFDGNQLFSKETSRIFNKKEIDGYIKIIEQFIKTNGYFAQSTGSARTGIVQLSEAMRESAERANQAGFSFANTVTGMRNFAMNVETARLAYDKTLRSIADLENRISAGQKANMDKESLEFMNGLKQRAQQWANVLKEILGNDMKGNSKYREFLSMSGNILTSPQLGNMFQALLGSDWKILLKDIGSTFNMLMKFSGFSKELSLDNTTISNWLKGEEAVRRLDNALKDLNRQWAATNQEAKTPDLTAKYEAQKQTIESLIAQIKGAMTEEARMSNRNGLADLLGVGYKNAAGYDNTRLIQEMRTASGEADKIARDRENAAQKAAEAEIKATQKAADETAKASQKKQEEINRAWAEYEKQNKKQAASYEQQQQREVQAKEKAEQQKRDAAYKAAENEVKQREKANEAIIRDANKADEQLIAQKEKAANERIKAAEKVAEAERKADEKSATAGISEREKRAKEIADAWAMQNKAIEDQHRQLEAAYDKRQRMQDAVIDKNKQAEMRAAREREKQYQKQTQQEINDYEKSQQQKYNARIRAAEALDRKISNLEARKNVDFAGLDTASLDAVINKLHRIREELANFAVPGTAKEIMEGMGLATVNREAIVATQQLNKEKRDAVNASNQLTESEQRLANAIKGSSDSMRNQSMILNDLKMMAYQYLSVWGAQNFINKIIETGGLLEQQRLSIGAILGDMEQAATLFGQIKTLALKSPFGVVELDKMSKQLTAYGFQYKELFEWTKRLADISAATGTEVSRLSLALGHVRSEGALSGYTLRQFAMANVPVLRMLSENLGISAKEVRDRVRKKEISYDDVKDVLKQLTDEGGMFYNAQEVMSQALNAKFKNLRDAFDIMYNEIAEGGVGDILKGWAEMLTAGAKHWERLGKTILEVGTAFGVSKVAMLLYNRALGEGTVSTLKSIAAAQQKENANYRLAYAAGLVTKEEYKQLLYNEKYSASAIKVALHENNLTIEELQRAVALGKVNKEVATAAVVSAGYDAALIKNVQVLGIWRKSLFLLGEGFRFAGKALKSFFVTMWPLAALTAIFELANKTSEQNDKASEAAENAAKATNRYSDLSAMTERLGSSQNKTTDQLTEGIEEMKKALMAVGEYNEGLKKQIDSVDSLSDKYEILKKKMQEVSDQARDKQSRKQVLIEEGLGTGGGTAWNPFNWFRDNALKDAKDIDDYTQSLYKALDQNSRVLGGAIKKYFIEYNKWKKEYNTMSIKDIFMSLSDEEKDDVLYYLRWVNTDNSIREAARSVAEALYGGNGGNELKNYSGYSYKGAIDELEGHQEELAKAFADAFNVDYPHIDLSKATKDQKIEFDKWLKNTLANIDDLKEAGQKALHDIIIRGTIKVVPEYQLDNKNWKDFLEDFKEQSPIGYQQWMAHSGQDNNVSTEEQKRKSAETYKRTFGNASINTLGNETKKRKKELDEEESKLNDYKKSIIYANSKEEQDRTQQRLNEIKEERKRLTQAQNDYNQHGDPDKKKGGSEDKEAKRLRERVRILKEANDSYQYWRKLVGDTAAQPHVNEEFGKLLGEQGFKFEDAKQYEKTLEDLRKKYQGIYDASEKAGKKRPQLLEAIKEIDKVLADLGRKDFEKATEDFLSKTQIELDNLTRSWETFNTVREATGDINLAIELSGADYEAGQTRNLADAVKQKIEEEFAAVGAVQIPFDIYMSDKEIEDSIKAAMPKANETQIKAFVEDYKKWRDLQRDVLKNDVQIFAKIIGSSQDYATQLQKITNDYDKNKESLDNMLKLYNSGQVDEKGNRRGINTDQYMKALQQIDADKELKVLKLGDQYAMYMAGAFGVMRDNVVETAQTIESKLNKAMKANVIDAKTYAEEMRKVRDMLDKYREESFFGKENPFVAFMNGGLKGSNDYVKSAIQALESKNGPLTAEEQKQLKTLKELQSSLSKTIGGLSSFAKVLLIAQGVVDGFSSAAQTLSDMFDALGQEGAANFWSDVSDSIKAGSSFLQPVNNILQNALSGNIGGVLSSAISAPVDLIAGPIIGFAQLSDKRHERRIQELKQEVTKIDNTLNTIKSLRERELGYDSGSLRRQMAAMYKSAYYSSSNDEPYSTIRGMREYYGRFSGGNGYSQEYNALIATRKKYMEMYDEEYEKKNSSNEALEEYKTKIAELDEQIMFFTEDLANELWGIDIQGWADQVADSIWTAFENGEDAVEAFGDTARDIVSSVAKEMWQLSVLEPRFKELREALFGPNGAIKYDSNGNIDMKASEQPVMEVLGKYLGPNGIFQQDIAAGEEFYNWVQKITGIDLSKESSSNASASIKNITEETADLLASYLNACRADVAANRAMIADYFPQYLSVMTSSNASLRNLEEQARLTAANTDAIKKSNQAILDNINGLKNKTWQVPIA